MFAALLLSFASSALIMAHEEKAFLNWMRQYNSIYSGDEYHFRLGIFLANKRFVENHRGSYRVGLTKFACYTPSEYRVLLGVIPSLSTNTQSATIKYDAPAELDWRDKGAVNEVKDQGSCGSCWAFSAIAGEEGTYFVTQGKLLVLSEQNIVDCTKECHGCWGGLPELALGQALNHQDHKFALDSDYPYVAIQQSSCLYDPSKGVADIKAITMYRKEEYIEGVVAKWGPTSVAIDASGSGFSMYTSGIYDGNDCGERQNHAVCVVGYAADYWIVRNSWGKSWGDNGYIKMKRNVNVCNIQGTITSVEI